MITPPKGALMFPSVAIKVAGPSGAQIYTDFFCTDGLVFVTISSYRTLFRYLAMKLKEIRSISIIILNF